MEAFRVDPKVLCGELAKLLAADISDGESTQDRMQYPSL
jgi:hypothetical protein